VTAVTAEWIRSQILVLVRLIAAFSTSCSIRARLSRSAMIALRRSACLRMICRKRVSSSRFSGGQQTFLAGLGAFDPVSRLDEIVLHQFLDVFLVLDHQDQFVGHGSARLCPPVP
jgi:hypothetical protein